MACVKDRFLNDASKFSDVFKDIFTGAITRKSKKCAKRLKERREKITSFRSLLTPWFAAARPSFSVALNTKTLFIEEDE